MIKQSRFCLTKTEKNNVKLKNREKNEKKNDAIWLFLFFLGLFQCWFIAMPLSPVSTYVYASFATLLVLDFVL